jgi:hypothetical protein
MQLEDIMLSEKPGSERQRLHVFSHTWKIHLKDKHAQKQTWSYKNSYVEHVCNSGSTLWNSGKEAKEKRVIENYHKIISVKVEDIRICTESCWTMGGGR